MNKIFLLGNVGNEPEVKHLESGSTVANFSLATSSTYKDKSGEKITNTEWHKIVVWRKLAEIVEKYVKKGSKLLIEGKMTYRTYEVEGVKKYISEVVCSELTMLGKNENSGKSENTKSGPKNDAPQEISQEEDLPF